VPVGVDPVPTRTWVLTTRATLAVIPGRQIAALVTHPWGAFPRRMMRHAFPGLGFSLRSNRYLVAEDGVRRSAYGVVIGPREDGDRRHVDAAEIVGPGLPWPAMPASRASRRRSIGEGLRSRRAPSSAAARSA